MQRQTGLKFRLNNYCRSFVASCLTLMPCNVLPSPKQSVACVTHKWSSGCDSACQWLMRPPSLLILSSNLSFVQISKPFLHCALHTPLSFAPLYHLASSILNLLRTFLILSLHLSLHTCMGLLWVNQPNKSLLGIRSSCILAT